MIQIPKRIRGLFFLKRIRRSLRFSLIILILHGWQCHFQRTCCVLLVFRSPSQELEIQHIKKLAEPRFVKSTVGMTFEFCLHLKLDKLAPPQMSGGKVTSNWDPSSWDFHNFFKSKINW